jgi:class 3 adenylate cyclase/DNA-binding transcriptional MerR regulator
VPTSKEVLEQTGISRATLNNYISGGLLPRPEVLPPEPTDGAAPRIGYFPEGTVERIREIQRLKAEGWSIARIAEHFERGGAPAAAAQAPAAPAPAPASPQVGPARAAALAPVDRPGAFSSRFGLDEVDHAAYAVDTEFQVLWSNPQARRGELGALLSLPGPQDEPAGVMACLLSGPGREREDLIGFHLEVARQRNLAASIVCAGLSPQDAQRVMSAYAAAPAVAPGVLLRASLPDVGRQAVEAHAVHLRRGVLFLYSAEAAAAEPPAGAGAEAVRRGPARLARVAVLAAQLQDSPLLWHQLPAQEYFDLANDVCESAATVITAGGGRQVRLDREALGAVFHAEDGNLHLGQAIRTAQQMREAMRQLSRRWQLRKGWTREIWVNVGLAEGEDWIATAAEGESSLALVMGDATQQALALAESAEAGSVWATRGLLDKLDPEQRARLRYGARSGGEFLDGCFMPAAEIGRASTRTAKSAFAAAEILAAAPAAAASRTAARPPLHS